MTKYAVLGDISDHQAGTIWDFTKADQEIGHDEDRLLGLGVIRKATASEVKNGVVEAEGTGDETLDTMGKSPAPEPPQA